MSMPIRDRAWRRARLAAARLYFVCEARPAGADPEGLLEAALEGGVDILQLRDSSLADEALVEPAPAVGPLSTTVTDRPARASSRATEQPTTPAPMTTVSVTSGTASPAGPAACAGRGPGPAPTSPQRRQRG